MDKKYLLGVGITNTTEKEILEYIIETIEKTKEKFYIVTPNPEILMFANKHKDFKEILNGAKIALCDGVGVTWAGKFLGISLKNRVTGVDLLESLCKEVVRKPITVGFLGGGPGIAELTAERLLRKYPSLKVGFVGEEWGEEGFVLAVQHRKTQNQIQKDTDSVVLCNVQSGSVIDILFVAFGFPKQEEWIVKNLQHIPVRVAMGVGGAFDYISGNVKRAPVWVCDLGFEWLFRLIRQPWRIKRQLALLEFIYLVIREKMVGKR